MLTSYYVYTQTNLPNRIFEPTPFQLKTLYYTYIYISTDIPPVVVTEQSRKWVGGDV